jgi:hypothetical protein
VAKAKLRQPTFVVTAGSVTALAIVAIANYHTTLR